MITLLRPRKCLLLTTTLLIFCGYAVSFGAEAGAPGGDANSSQLTPAQKIYGICGEGLTVCSGTVRPGNTLAQILTRHDVPYGRILEAAASAKGVFDVRRLHPGHAYRVFVNPASGAQHFVYQKSVLDYVVFDLAPTVAVRKWRQPTETRLHTVSATIVTSLWEALHKQGLPGELIIRLEDIFGQAADFFALRPGDGIRLVYEEIWADGRRVQLGDILAARLEHQGRAYDAYGVHQQHAMGYYDADGRSLQRAFLKAPLRYSRITSGFSHRRFHPILKIYRSHYAIDYAAPIGTPVLAVGDGRVTRIGVNRHAGKYLRLSHGSRYASQYMHLSRFAAGVRTGRQVCKGDVIGYVGRSGLATGPHLDFRFYRNGRPVNFARIELPAGNPVPDALRSQLSETVVNLKPRLAASATRIVSRPAAPSIEAAEPGA